MQSVGKAFITVPFNLSEDTLLVDTLLKLGEAITLVFRHIKHVFFRFVMAFEFALLWRLQLKRNIKRGGHG